MPEHSCCLAIDAMGGDHGPRLVVSSVLNTLHRYPNLRCKLFGPENVIASLIKGSSENIRSRFSIVHCSQQVSMEDKPAYALRHRRQSSMWLAIDSVARGEADACVSGGNTGALMAMGIYLLDTFPGIERPAICTSLPTAMGKAYLLDMGANIDCDATQLFQFATMASAKVSAMDGIEAPRIGLLNVASEEGKGPQVVRDAAELLEASNSLNYCGFVEGDGIYSGRFDIIVCDGFTGNVVLKSNEGAAHLIADQLRLEIKGSLVKQIAAFIARSSLRAIFQRFDPANYNGASLLGLKKTVVKSHGSATEAGFSRALEEAMGEVENGLIEKISQNLTQSDKNCANSTQEN